jgi:hypothetical protein
VSKLVSLLCLVLAAAFPVAAHETAVEKANIALVEKLGAVIPR